MSHAGGTDVKESFAQGLTNRTPNPYDAVAYVGRPLPQTHPNRLATLATLFGMKPAPVECCRVLELGCGDGGNLIPMALGLPRSTFVGIDLAGLPIAEGTSMVEALGLENISLRQADILDVSPDLGEFDYIIAHGIYSWVPAAVQDKLLAVCKVNLAPNGVAYVSYNTYPGHHLQAVAREMMRYHLSQAVCSELDARIQHALAVVEFVANARPEPGTYQMLLKQILEQDLLQRSPAALYHDDLAEVNLPVYFYQFIEHAGGHGLQFLSEANFPDMQERGFPPHVCETLWGLAKDQILLREQYLDFLKGRKFRQTLLCHRVIALDREVALAKVMDLHAASHASPVSPQPDILSTAVEEFTSSSGLGMSTGHPFAKAVVMQLIESWPRSLSFNELLALSRARIVQYAKAPRSSASEECAALSRILLGGYAAGVVELQVHVSRFMTEVSERPLASPLARLQARKSRMVASLRHSSVQLQDDLMRHLLMLLDGTRDRAALLRDLVAAVTEESAALRNVGGIPNDEEELAQILAGSLEDNLQKMAQLALLLA